MSRRFSSVKDKIFQLLDESAEAYLAARGKRNVAAEGLDECERRLDDLLGQLKQELTQTSRG